MTSKKKNGKLESNSPLDIDFTGPADIQKVNKITTIKDLLTIEGQFIMASVVDSGIEYLIDLWALREDYSKQVSLGLNSSDESTKDVIVVQQPMVNVDNKLIQEEKKEVPPQPRVQMAIPVTSINDDGGTEMSNEDGEDFAGLDDLLDQLEDEEPEFTHQEKQSVGSITSSIQEESKDPKGNSQAPYMHISIESKDQVKITSYVSSDLEFAEHSQIDSDIGFLYSSPVLLENLSPSQELEIVEFSAINWKKELKVVKEAARQQNLAIKIEA